MSLFSKRLMKWREPKIRGMLTPKNVLALYALILVISIPFGFLGGSGKFHLKTCLLALGFMSVGSIGFLISPLLPGTQIQLREDAIVRAMSRRTQRAAYKDIDCIRFYRNCSYSWNQSLLVVNVNQRSIEGPNFTNFVITLKNDVDEKGFSYASRRSVQQFAVPDDVNVEQVVQILHDKGVRVLEGSLPS